MNLIVLTEEPCAGEGETLSSNPRPKLSSSLLKPVTPDTEFYIDYDWWDRSKLDIKTYLSTRLSMDQEIFDTDVDEVDIIHPETGEVKQVDGFQFVVQTYFNQLPEDFATRTSLVDAVFCVLLANANQPMSAKEIAKRVHRSVDVVLRTIGGPQIYQGIRRVPQD